jgi:diguanylate cyclase (GGDEF)-like protein
VTILIYEQITLILMAAVMYSRWNNPIYANLIGAFIFSAAVFLLEHLLDHPMMSWLRLVVFFVTVSALFRLHYPKRVFPRVWLFIICGVILLIGITSFYIKSGAFINITGIAVALSIIFLGRNDLQGRPVGIVALIFFAAAFLFNLLDGSLPFKFDLSTFMLNLAFFLVFYLVFVRIVDLMQAATYSSTTDGLTGLYNRKHLNRLTESAVQSGTIIGAIFMDIDNFKKLNDTKGHDEGDRMLKAVAAILRDEVDSVGYAGRYGGEELVGVVIQGRKPSLKNVAERIRLRVEKETIVTVSVGIGYYKGNLTATQLVKAADDAMYKAKTTGKNKVVSFEEIESITEQEHEKLS